MAIPLQENCDPANPEEAFLWAFVGLPGPQNGPMLLPPQILGKWSKHFWDLGFRHYPCDQTKEYHPPTRGSDHWLNSAGRWVPMGTPRPAKVTIPDVHSMTVEERQALVAQLQATGDLANMVDTRTLEPDKARVGTHQPAEDAGVAE
jgi:hypothetical protein